MNIKNDSILLFVVGSLFVLIGLSTAVYPSAITGTLNLTRVWSLYCVFLGAILITWTWVTVDNNDGATTDAAKKKEQQAVMVTCILLDVLFALCVAWHVTVVYSDGGAGWTFRHKCAVGLNMFAFFIILAAAILNNNNQTANNLSNCREVQLVPNPNPNPFCCFVNIFLFCYNESAIIRQTINYYQNRFKNCRIVVMDNHSTDDSVNIAKACGASVVFWGDNGTFNNYLLTNSKNTIWKNNNSNGWVIICDMDEWLDINDTELCREHQSGTTIISTQGYQMVANSSCPNLSDIKLSSIRSGYPDNMYSKNIMFLSSAIVDINYSLGAHLNSPKGNVKFSTKKYKLGHFKFLGLKYLLHNYNQSFMRTIDDRKKNLAVHYSNDDETITAKYNEAYSKSKIINTIKFN